MRNHAAQFITEIRKFHRHNIWRVFSDYCELAACSLSNSVSIGAAWEKREAQYLGIAQGYNKEEMSIFPKLLAITVEALEHEMQDFLGAVFMELELGNHWKGQYFTPYPVSRLMAEITYAGEMDRSVSQRGFITLSDPACGAGCMIIAFAEVMRTKEIDYQRQLHATCVDVDATAAHMAFIQLSLLHIPAIIVVGNSLSLETRDTFYTPAHVLGLWSSKLSARNSAAKADTEGSIVADPLAQFSAVAAQRPSPLQSCIQISLFD